MSVTAGGWGVGMEKAGPRPVSKNLPAPCSPSRPLEPEGLAVYRPLCWTWFNDLSTAGRCAAGSQFILAGAPLADTAVSVAL